MSFSWSSCQAAVMFLTSSLSFVWMITNRPVRSSPRLIATSTSKYNSVLSELFSVIPRGQRNVDSDLTSKRFKHFSERFEAAKLKGTTKVIHIAGTKGKGSTVEYLNAALTRSGYKVGVFTSPHLHTARERIKIGKQLIGKEDFIRIADNSLATMKPLGWPVFFDLFLDMAIQYFGEKQVDFVILETGIGGTFDSTNFIEDPVAAVITSISLDHQALLGDTVEEIAAQKAGIIKYQSKVFVSSSQKPSVLDVFKSVAVKMQANLAIVPVARGKPILSGGLQPDFDVQCENSCLALAVLKWLGVNPAGMSDFYWPCRMESFQIPQENDAQAQVIVDGCHNGDSILKFLQGVKAKFPSHRIVVLFGAGVDKTVDDMLDVVVNNANVVKFLQSKHFKSMTEKDLTTRFVNFSGENRVLFQSQDHINVDRVPGGTVGSRLSQAICQYREEDDVIIVVCGSLFVAAEAREWIFSKYPSLFSQDDWVRSADEI